MALWPASIILGFGKWTDHERRKIETPKYLSKDSSPLELCKCERRPFKRTGLSEKQSHPLLQSDPQSGRKQPADRSLIFSVREALSSQTEPNRPASLPSDVCTGYRVRGSPLQGPLWAPGSGGGPPPPPRHSWCPAPSVFPKRTGYAGQHLPSHAARPARQWGGEMKERVVIWKASTLRTKLNVPGLINPNKISMYMHHYTMVHVSALKCVCVVCVWLSWVCVFALKYLNA